MGHRNKCVLRCFSVFLSAALWLTDDWCLGYSPSYLLSAKHEIEAILFRRDWKTKFAESSHWNTCRKMNPKYSWVDFLLLSMKYIQTKYIQIQWIEHRKQCIAWLCASLKVSVQDYTRKRQGKNNILELQGKNHCWPQSTPSTLSIKWHKTNLLMFWKFLEVLQTNKSKVELKQY